jgi:hypothetical protein
MIMDQTTATTVLGVGALLPLLTSIVQQPGWSDKTRTWVGVAISVVAGFLTYVSQYGLDFSTPAQLATVIIGVALTSAASYRAIWKTSGIAEAVEVATSPNRISDPLDGEDAGLLDDSDQQAQLS